MVIALLVHNFNMNQTLITMENMIMGIISLVMLLVFIVMAMNIAAMKTQLKGISKIAEAYSKQTGIGKTYTCNGCKKKFEGKQANCPHCKIVIPW